MSDVVVDMSDKVTVNSATQSAVYSYQVQNDRVLVLAEVSVFADTNFQTNGKITVVAGGRAVTSQNSQVAEVGINSNFTIAYPALQSHPKLWKVLQQGQTVEVRARITTGSGVLNIILVGVLMTMQEYETILRGG